MNPFNPTFNRSSKPSVCFKCPERTLRCHVWCPKYAEEVAERKSSPDTKQKEERVFMQNYKMGQKRRR